MPDWKVATTNLNSSYGLLSCQKESKYNSNKLNFLFLKVKKKKSLKHEVFPGLVKKNDKKKTKKQNPTVNAI